jgi:ribosomal protein S18 acetylase RimI-like enzyme
MGATTQNILIRPLNFPEDYDEVYALWENAGAGIHLRVSDELDEIRKKIERAPNLFLVAQAGDSIIGTVLGGFDGRRGMMYHLAVSQTYRRKGIASLLVDALEEKLKEKGCIRYYLLVTKDNQEAISFYEKRGWENMDDLHIFAKNLT